MPNDDFESDDAFQDEDIWDKESQALNELDGFMEDEYELACADGFIGSFSDWQDEKGI